MNNILIRQATIEDVEDLAILKKEMWETTYRGIYSDNKLDNYDINRQKEKFRNIINSPDIELYLVIYDDRPVGYMSNGRPVRRYKDYKQEIGLMYLLKGHQGKGIGKKLFNLALTSIKKRGHKCFFVSCNKYNYNAQQFYLKMGGKIIHIDDDEQDKSEPQVKIHYDIE